MTSVTVTAEGQFMIILRPRSTCTAVIAKGITIKRNFLPKYFSKIELAIAESILKIPTRAVPAYGDKAPSLALANI